MSNSMKLLRDFFAATLLVVGSVLLAAVPANAQKVSVCKGLSKTACEANDGCSHVSGFTRSDGASVKAHCRAKPGNNAKKTDKTKKKTTKKAKDESSGAKKAKDKVADTKKTTKSKAADAKKKPAKVKKAAKESTSKVKKPKAPKKPKVKKTKIKKPKVKKKK